MKLKRKKLLTFSILFTILFFLWANPVFAAEEAIPFINIDVILQSDGSAVITETWNVQGVSSGTEYYKALYNMDGMSVHSLLVWDESGTQYKTMDDWDTGLSLEEKSGTCGILKTSDGYELCWGIGSYGDHQYTVQYTLEGLVKDYGDYAGFYHQFISELSSAPKSTYIEIRLVDTQLTAGNARIWAYGLTGEVIIGSNGDLKVFSSEALDSGGYVNVLCRFDRSLFPLAPTSDMSFEKLQESAENENSDTVLYVILAILGSIIMTIVILITFFYSRYKLADGTTARLPKRKEIDTNWTIPFDGSIPAVYSAMQILRKNISYKKLMSAYLIRWQEMGYIHMEKRKKEDAVVFRTEKKPAPGVEQSLYEILTYYADRDDILWSSDIEKQAEGLYKKLTVWAKKVKLEGEKELIRSNIAAKNPKGVILFTVSGFKQAVSILGFQKYLLKMRGKNKDNTAPRELWGDYLVFAALFGIGEQVLKSLKAFDPAYFDTFSNMYGCNAYSMMYFMTITNHISSVSATNTDGTGGSASSSGGGGFSGGGGGGSR